MFVTKRHPVFRSRLDLESLTSTANEFPSVFPQDGLISSTIADSMRSSHAFRAGRPEELFIGQKSTIGLWYSGTNFLAPPSPPARPKSIFGLPRCGLCQPQRLCFCLCHRHRFDLQLNIATPPDPDPSTSHQFRSVIHKPTSFCLRLRYKLCSRWTFLYTEWNFPSLLRGSHFRLPGTPFMM